MVYLVEKVEDFFDDFAHNGRKMALFTLGKGSIKTSPELINATAGLIVGGTSTVGHYLTPIVIPAGAVFSSALVQGDHLHRREKLLSAYREEIGSVLGKSAQAVTEQDMDLVAQGDEKGGIKSNPTLKEALDQSAKERNWGVAISAIASVTTGLVVGGLMHSAPGAPPALLEGFSLPTTLAMVGAISLGIYQAISLPMHYVAEKMFGLDRDTVQDRIHSIHHAVERGRTVSQEKVFGAFVQAHPQIDTMIAQGFGKKFDRLNKDDKRTVLNIIGPQVELEKLTQDINLGHIKCEELAFVVHGQLSGVERSDTPREMEKKESGGFISRTWKACVRAVSMLFEEPGVKRIEEPVSIPIATPSAEAVVAAAPQFSTAHGNDRQAAPLFVEHEVHTHQRNMEREDANRNGANFAGRFAAHRTDPSKTHVERLEQARSLERAPSAQIPSPT